MLTCLWSLKAIGAIRYFGNEKGTGAEMCPAIDSGIVPGDATVSSWSMAHVRSLNYFRFLRVVFSSQQRLNRPAINAI